MIAVTVRYYNILCRHTGVECEDVELPEGTDLGAAVRHLAERHGPALATLLLSPAGEISSYLVIFVNQEFVSPGRYPPLADGDELKIFPSISGG